jgi:hypothetical protein
LSWPCAFLHHAAYLKIETVTTLLTFSAFVHIGILWQVHDLDQPGSGKLAGFSGGDIVRVTGNPQLRQSMTSGEGQQQSASPGSVMVSPMFWMNAVTEMPGVHDQVESFSDPQLDATDFFTLPGLFHFELIGRHIVHGRVGRVGIAQDELEGLHQSVFRDLETQTEPVSFDEFHQFYSTAFSIQF